MNCKVHQKHKLRNSKMNCKTVNLGYEKSFDASKWRYPDDMFGIKEQDSKWYLNWCIDLNMH